MKPNPNNPEEPSTIPEPGQTPDNMQPDDRGGITVPFTAVCDTQERNQCPVNTLLNQPDDCLCGSQRHKYEFAHNQLIEAYCLEYEMPGGTKGKMLVKKQGLEKASVTWAKDYPKDACNNDNKPSGGKTCYCAVSDQNKNTNTLPDGTTKYLDICTKDRPYCASDGHCYQSEAEVKEKACPSTDELRGCRDTNKCGGTGWAQQSKSSSALQCPNDQVCCITECEQKHSKNYEDSSGNYYCVSESEKANKCKNPDDGTTGWKNNDCPDKGSTKYGCCLLK